VLFIIFIDGLVKLLEEYGIKCKVFADGIKVYISVQNVNCTVKLQNVLNLISDWATNWQLSISISKCNIFSIGNTFLSAPYQIDTKVLPHVTSCKDLGIMLTSELSPTAHIASITAKGHQRANAILRCFESRDRDLLFRAFTTYVRPLLEYNSVVWSPYLKSDIEAVETVQRKYTKRLAGLKKLSCDQRLKMLDLPSLELRLLYADLLWCYKIVFGVADVTHDDFFQLCFTSITRGHTYKLYKPCCTNSKRSHFLHAEL